MRCRIASAVLCTFLWGCFPAQARQRAHPQGGLNRIGSRDLTKGDWDLYSPRREYKIGKSMAQQVEHLVTPLDDPLTRTYVQNLADRIVRHSDAKVPVDMKIIYSNEVDAFALPGGFVFITTGLILRTRSEAELAGVVAREVAYTAERDATREMTQEAVLNWMSLPLLEYGGAAGFAIGGSIVMAEPLGSRVFNRRAEERADFLGLQYLYKSGYDPEGYINFFERVKRLEKVPRGIVARAFSPHSLIQRRITAAEREIQKDLPARQEYVETTSAYQLMRERLDQIVRDQTTAVPRPVSKIPVLKKGFAARCSHPEDWR